MNLSVGIVGLPNVGKSTLFNALLKKQQALAANYPFATIEPNVGIVAVPDKRLNQLAEITKEEEKMSALPPLKPATIEFVDIAGLVKGASEGAGLGNKFLSHIREVNIIAHVIRGFSEEDIIREGSIDPTSDYLTIQTELILADIQTLEKVNTRKHESHSASSGQAKLKNYEAFIERLKNELNQGLPVRSIVLTVEEQDAIKDLFLLSAKPEIVVLNVSETDYIYDKILHFIDLYSSKLVIPKERVAVISAQTEVELVDFSEEEHKEYLKAAGLSESGLEQLIRKSYDALGLISFLTTGQKEVKAWTINKGIDAQNAAGVIHTDFIKKFIKAEVVSFDDFVQNHGWKGSRELGKARLEGRDYIMHDGDVVEFKIGT